MLRNPYDIYGGCADDEEVYCSLNYSEESPYHHQHHQQQQHREAPEYVPASLLSSISPRQYIDPWDLENYAYLQRTRETETDIETTTDAEGDCCESTASSQFYWATNKQDYYKRLKRAEDTRNMYSCDGSCNSPLCDANIYGYREPQLMFPPPPNEYDQDSDAQTVIECQECTLSYDKRDPDYYYQDQQPIYSTSTPQFSLNKKGLLQIDYSCNWNCLDFNFSKLRM